MRTDYVPGRGRAVVAGDTVALLPDGATPDQLAGLWASVRSGAGVTDHLQVLLAAGIAAAPSFALVRVEAGAAHVVARGSARVDVTTEQGLVTVAAGRVSTWTEQLVADVLELTIEGVGAQDGPSLPLVAGVVPADRVSVEARVDVDVPARRVVPVLDLGASAAPGAPAGPVAPVVPVEGMAAARVIEPAGASVHEEPAAAPEPVAAPEPAAVPEPAVPAPASHLEQLGLRHRPPAPPTPAAGIPVVTPALEAALAAALEADRLAEPLTGPLTPPLVPMTREPAGSPFRRAGEAVPADGPVDDPVVHEVLHAPTLENPIVPPAAVAPAGAPDVVVPELEDDEDDDVVGGLPVWEPILAPIRTGPPPTPPTPWSVHGDPGPAVERVQQPVAVPVPHGLPEDHDGFTVLSSDVVALRRQLPDWAGDAVPQLSVPTQHTPAPAKLLMSTGLVVSLNRPVLIGRAPQVTRVTGNEIPRLVTVASPNQDISRTHAEVRMDGEDVVVTDLRSTNGVLLLRQGQGAQRLHPGEPTVVEPGVVVDLGEGVTFLVEAGG